MAAGSGSTRLESADERRIIHVNSFEVDTDPYLLNSQIMNGELISQYPRFVHITSTTVLVPDPAGPYALFSWGLNITNITRTTFTGTINGVKKIPQIDPRTEINTVVGQLTQLYFPKGGYWIINAYVTFLNNLVTINTGTVFCLEYSNDSGVTWVRVAGSSATQPAVAIAPVNTLSVAWNNYFHEGNSGEVQRIRFIFSSTQAMAAGVTLNVNLQRLR